MSEDATRNFQPSFEDRVLREFAAISARLTSLEDKVDERLRETRPIWEGVQAELKEIGKQLTIFNRQLKVLIQDSFDMRSRLGKLGDSQPI